MDTATAVVWRVASLLVAAGPVHAQDDSQKAADPKPQAPAVLWTIPLSSASFGAGAVADVNGDGILDIAFCTYFGDSKVRVVSGRDGSEIWSFDAGQGAGRACLDASCRFADLDSDGTLDLVVPVSNTSQVIAFDARSGARKWTYEAGHGECIDTPPWIGDADGDGATDIVVGTFKSRLHVIRARDGAMVRSVQIAPRGAVQSCPVVVDLNGDGLKDFVASTFNGDHRVVAANGAVGEPPLGEDRGPRPVHELWHVQTGGSMYHGVSVGDLDGDGRPDLAVGSYDGKVYAFRSDGSEIWTAAIGERYIMGPTVIADVNGDRKPEVIVAGDRVTAISADGTTLWSVPFDAPGSYWSVTRGVSVADMDGDGSPDLAALNGRGLFKVLRGRDGATLFELDCAPLCDKPVRTNSHLPLIADFDADGRVDVFLVVGHADGRNPQNGTGAAVCLTGFGGPARVAGGALNGWFMHRHDAQNSGNMATPLEPAQLKALGAGN